MEYGPEAASRLRWLPARFETYSERSLVFALAGVALAIRIYLSLTSFCISGDGVAYLRMARDFAAGHPAAAMRSVFSPLYPLLIAALHLLIPGWEISGELISAFAGTAVVFTVYYLVREIFGSRDIALGAGVLAAIHPELAAYSASVRTEAGFILLFTAATLLIVRAVKRQSFMLIAAGGVTAGLAYLYRTEAIGIVLVAALFMPIGARIWRRWRMRWAMFGTGLFLLCFGVIAAPYLIFLRASTGHWTVGREFTAAMMYGMGEVAPNQRLWRQLGFSMHASPLAAIAVHPWLYAEKVVGDLLASLYGFVQALGPVLTLLMAVGLWVRRRQVFANFAEAFLALLVLFYFCGFTLTYTGTRFMVHLIPFTFGWVIIGVAELAYAAQRTFAWTGWCLPPATIGLVIALILLPRTLWPIGYDLRGFRYAGQEIARRDSSGAVVARDGRVAYYAGSKLIALPETPVPNLCRWLDAHESAAYLLIGNRDERKFGIEGGARCLTFIKRYPRYGTGYYDLFAIQDSQISDASGAGNHTKR
jgi:hypothetical protein